MYRSYQKQATPGSPHMSFVQRQKLIMKQRELATMAKGAVHPQLKPSNQIIANKTKFNFNDIKMAEKEYIRR